MSSYREAHVVSELQDGAAKMLELLPAGASGGPTRIAMTLEIVNGDSSCVAYLLRKKGGAEYARIRIDLLRNDYVVLWEHPVVIPADTSLSFGAEAVGVTAVLHYEEEA